MTSGNAAGIPYKGDPQSPQKPRRAVPPFCVVTAWCLGCPVTVNAALGMNGYTLQVYARVRIVVTNSVIAALLGLGLNLWLIPVYGAIGAAWATSGAIIVHNLLNQAGLHFGTGVDVFRAQGLKLYGSILLATLGLVVLRAGFELQLIPLIVLVAIVFLVLLRINRSELNIANAFPELARVPGFRFLLAAERGR